MNKFYVYFHRRTSDNTIFYVGKGTGKRAWSKDNRGQEWYTESDSGFTVEIVKNNLSNTEALALENELINTIPNLINCYSSTVVPLDYAELSKHFVIDPTSPSGLSRICGSWNGLTFKGKLGHCGSVCGKSSKKYWRIKFKNKTVPVHRIIMILLGYSIPDGYVVDHIDGNSLNNNLGNLRIVSQDINARNRTKSKNNTSGFSGVYFDTTNYRVIITLDNKKYSKRFYFTHHGENTLNVAVAWREEKIKELNNLGAGYTERHGTRN